MKVVCRSRRGEHSPTVHAAPGLLSEACGLYRTATARFLAQGRYREEMETQIEACC